jgi:hypothetical protein
MYVFSRLALYLLTFVAAQYESTLNKLANAETQIEDLKVQLDDALGAEDLLVQLTERNLVLGEVWSTPSPHICRNPNLISTPENRGNAHHNRRSRSSQGAQR